MGVFAWLGSGKFFSHTGTGSEADPAVLDVSLSSPGTGATSLGKAEDSAHTSGDVGVMTLAVRQNTAAALGTTDGDYNPLIVDTNGRLHVIEPSAAAGAASLSVMDDWDSTDACKSVAIQKSVIATVAAANLIAAAGDYLAGDLISDNAATGVAWKFTALGRVASGTLTVVGASIAATVEGFVPRVRIWLFNAVPSAATVTNDNAALAIDLDDRAKLQACGYIDLPAMADIGEMSFAQVTGLSLKCQADASGDVYALVQLLDAVTNESAGMSVWPSLSVIQD